MGRETKVNSNHINTTDLEVAKAFVREVRSQGIPVEQAFLFGSRAKGMAHKWSDLDICIVSPSFGRDRLEERVRLMNLRHGISDLIEPHPYSPEDLQNKFDPLASQIRTTGVRLV